MNPLKELFFVDTLRRWRFGSLLNSSGLSRERVNHFLKQLKKEGFIKRIKPRSKMPYYLANRDNSQFRFEKRIYGYLLLEKSGLFKHLHDCKEIKTAILFGSFARGDWNRSSDIDLFIYGDDSVFEKSKFEHKLKHELQLFSYQQPKLIKKHLDSKVIANISRGFHIKGTGEPFKVEVYV